MDSFEVTLKGETGAFYWHMGKICAKGYELENERLMLALNGGFGEDIGALLVALDEYCQKPMLLIEIFENWDKTMEEVRKAEEKGRFSSRDWLWGLPPIFFQYLSFSPNVAWRINAAHMGNFNVHGIKRLLGDPQIDVIIEMIHFQKIPLEYCHRLASHPHKGVRAALILDTPWLDDPYKVLAQDLDQDVRCSVAMHTPNISLLETLAKDDEYLVRAGAFRNPKFPLALAKEVEIQQSRDDLLTLALNCANEDVLQYLLAKEDLEITSEAIRSPIGLELFRLLSKRMNSLEKTPGR